MKKSRSSERSLHGNAPDRCPVALLLIDLINDLQFPGAERIAPRAQRAAKRLARLKERAARAGVPCIYVNDNFGRWRSDFRAQVRHCLANQTAGSAVCALLEPAEHDYFVLKPKHSGFYNTCLDLLLEHLDAKVLVLAGIATDNCVTFTANDAFLRGYRIVLAQDGCASQDQRTHRLAIAQMRRLLKARVARCSDIAFVGPEPLHVRISKRR